MMEYAYTRSFRVYSGGGYSFPWGDVVTAFMNGKQVWPPLADGAWPENADIPLGYDERDAKGV